MPRKSKDELKADVLISKKETIATKTVIEKEKKAIADPAIDAESAKVSKAVATKKETKSKTAKKATKSIADKEEKSSNSTTKSGKVTKKKSIGSDTESAKGTNKKSVDSDTKSEKEINEKSVSSSTKPTKRTKNTSSAKKKASTNSKAKKILSSVEYYDLPYRYNETVVKILAQTPTMLFIYWDIADSDKDRYIQQFGENFFEKTKPVLIVKNKTMNYTFEVDINDFANSWYLHVNDADCDYSVELGRRPIDINSNIDSYVYITTSNDMEMPNNYILLDKLGKTVFFRNIKNNIIEEKDLSSISFLKNLGKVYDIYEFYQEMYQEEMKGESMETLKLNLSSSSSSSFPIE